jgi:8-hydroxy-5-deazaflavin:NADPH oxidoreductase
MASTPPRRFGVLGSGPVGQTLASGLKKHGYEVQIGTRTPGKLGDFSRKTGIPAGQFADVAAWAEALILAVHGRAAHEALQLAGAGNLAGKVVIDTTNPLDEGPPEDGVLRVFTGSNESLMEQLQGSFPQAHLVKAFNSVGNALMVNPALPGGRPTMFICATRVLDQFGWDTEDMGKATAARAIEPLCILWCIPGFLHNDWAHAFRMLRPAATG